MKKILLLLLVLPFLSFSQEKPKQLVFSEGVQDSIFGSSIILKNNAVLYQKVYESTLSKEELISKIKSFLPMVKSFQLTDIPNQQGNQFSGRLTNFVVNYRRHGGSLMGTATVLNYPLDASVIVQVKDNKYRVVVSDIMFKGVKILLNDSGSDVLLDDFATKKKRTLFNTNTVSVKALKYIDKDFLEAFDINTAKASDDF